MGRAYVRWAGAECADTVRERRAEARSGERWSCGWGVPAQPRLDRGVAIGRGRRGVPADGREDRCRTRGDRDQCRGTALASAYAIAGRGGVCRLIAVSVRGLRLVVTVPGLGQPGRVHRAGMRHRQPSPPQAGSGQQKRESQNAAPPDDADHAAKLARAPLLRKREGLLPCPHSQYALAAGPNVGFRGPGVAGFRLTHQADELGAGPQRIEPGIAGERGRTVKPAMHHSIQ
jgi:hypothetical protein